MVRHSHQDALSSEEFGRLVDGALQLDETDADEALIAIYLAGRLGMRIGEIVHLRRSWVNWERMMIEIPRFEPCRRGQDGGVCGYCRQQAKQALTYDSDATLDEKLAQRWTPKTETSARAIPFDFDETLKEIVIEFFAEYDEFPKSRVTLTRRVKAAAEKGGLNTEFVYPHALRATAATHHAYRGLSAAPLQALMGWRKLEVAEKYLRLSGGATAEALRDVHLE